MNKVPRLLMMAMAIDPEGTANLLNNFFNRTLLSEDPEEDEVDLQDEPVEDYFPSEQEDTDLLVPLEAAFCCNPPAPVRKNE